MKDISAIDKNMAIPCVCAEGIAWYDPASAPFRVGGLAWFAQDGVYRRLPDDPALPSAVNDLRWNTTGGTIAFRTNANRILVDVDFGNCPFAAMWHFAPTGASGIDLYTGEPGHWKTSGVLRMEIGTYKGQAELLRLSTPPQWRDCLLNLPLYGGIRSIRIGVEEEAQIAPPTPWASHKRIVIYGGSTVQGACVSRPGRAYMNIIARHFNLDMVNLGFSGSSRFEPVLAKYTAAVKNPCVVFVEGDRNAGIDRVRDLEPAFIQTIRDAHPEVPIVVLHGNKVWDNDTLTLSEAKRLEIMEEQQKFVHKMQEHDKHLFWWNCQDFLGEDHTEATVDGLHPNDLGAYRIAENMIERLKTLLD